MALVAPSVAAAGDAPSQKLSALPPHDADRVARADLLSALQPSVKVDSDFMGNVQASTFVTWPYSTMPAVCQEDEIVVSYALIPPDFGRRPTSVATVKLFHIAKLPVTWGSYNDAACDIHHPDARAVWFAAPTLIDAIRAMNMFRTAEDQVKAGMLTPGPCDAHGAQTCGQWVASLDDFSKIKSVGVCPTAGDGAACYVLSFGLIGGDELTIVGKFPPDSEGSSALAPAAVTAVRVRDVQVVIE